MRGVSDSNQFSDDLFGGYPIATGAMGTNRNVRIKSGEYNIVTFIRKEVISMGAIVKDNYYHGSIRYQKRNYWLDEVHDIEKFVGKYCIAVEVPGVNHDPQIFTISVRYYDNERNENPEANNDNEINYKRPALFETKSECLRFMSQLYFPDKHLRIHQIDNNLCRHKLFIEFGAYFVKESRILVP